MMTDAMVGREIFFFLGSLPGAVALQYGKPKMLLIIQWDFHWKEEIAAGPQGFAECNAGGQLFVFFFGASQLRCRSRFGDPRLMINENGNCVNSSVVRHPTPRALYLCTPVIEWIPGSFKTGFQGWLALIFGEQYCIPA